MLVNLPLEHCPDVASKLGIKHETSTLVKTLAAVEELATLPLDRFYPT